MYQNSDEKGSLVTNLVKSFTACFALNIQSVRAIRIKVKVLCTDSVTNSPLSKKSFIGYGPSIRGESYILQRPSYIILKIICFLLVDMHQESHSPFPYIINSGTLQ